MLLQATDHSFSGYHSAQEACSVIPSDYHAPVLKSCALVKGYLHQHVAINEIPESVSEIVQLVFQKIEDELTYTFRKETGIVFPHIQQQLAGAEYLQPKVIEAMLNTHQVLIQLFQKLRQLMQHYITKPDWSQSLKSCVHEMFLLETYVLRWIQFEQTVLYPQLISIAKPA